MKQKLMVSLLEYKDCGCDVIGCKEYDIENNKIPSELVDNFIIEKNITTTRGYGKLTTILEYKLQNGFTGTESTTCVDEKNYSEEIGGEILLGRLKDKIWFGLGFALGMAQ